MREPLLGRATEVAQGAQLLAIAALSAVEMSQAAGIPFGTIFFSLPVVIALVIGWRSWRNRGSGATVIAASLLFVGPWLLVILAPEATLLQRLIGGVGLLAALSTIGLVTLVSRRRRQSRGGYGMAIAQAAAVWGGVLVLWAVGRPLGQGLGFLAWGLLIVAYLFVGSIAGLVLTYRREQAAV